MLNLENTASTEAQSPADSADEEFSALCARLLTLVGHFQLVDQRLYDFDRIDEDLVPAGTVLHGATKALDRLHSDLDGFGLKYRHVLVTDEERIAGTAPYTAGMTPEEREHYTAKLRADLAERRRPSEEAKDIADRFDRLPESVRQRIMAEIDAASQESLQ